MTANRYERLSLSGIDPGRTITQRLTFVRAMSGEVPLLSMYALVGVTTDSSVDLRYDPRRQSLRTATDTRRIVGYSVRAQPQPTANTQRILTDLIKPLGRVGWFRDDDGRVAARARQLLVAAGLPAETPSLNREDPRFPYSDAWTWNAAAAAVFTDYLQGPEFTYTLDLSDIRVRASEDPIAAFVLSGKRGHCEYFASALAALCHSVDIPARVIAGFIAQEYDAVARQYTVLEGNAHAWAEVGTGPHLWASFDPTPPAALPHLVIDSGALADTMRSMYSRFEGNWSSNVVGFDDSAQGRLIDQVSQGWTKRLTAWLDAVRDGMERVNMFFNVGQRAGIDDEVRQGRGRRGVE
jgi:transglutaminase-like putative cysteine protease